MKIYFKLIIATFKDIIRDPTAMLWTILMPLILMLIFGGIFNNTTTNSNYNIGLVVEDQGTLGSIIKKAFVAESAFKLHQGSKAKVLEALKNGECDLVVVVPPYKAGTSVKNPLEIPIYYNSGKVAVSHVLLTSMRQLLLKVEKEITDIPELLITNPAPKLLMAKPIKTKVITYKTIDFLFPGLLAMNLMQIGLFGCLSYVNLRERKIIRRLSATPLPRSVLLWSEITVRQVWAFIQIFILFLVGYLVFGVRISGNPLVIVGIIIFGSSVFTMMGYCLTNLTKTENSAVGLIQLVQIPMMFLSGVLFPPNVMSNLFKQIMNFIPLTYLADLLRSVIIGIPSAYGINFDVIVLGSLLVVTSLLTIKFFKWE